jgi:hypothetical protein
MNAKGDRLPGVTTVINNLGWSKDGLVFWAHKMGRLGRNLDQARQGAADIGTVCHDLAEAFIQHIMWWGSPDGWEAARDARLALAPEPFRAPALEAFGAFYRWALQSRGTIIATELWFVDEEYQTGGCIDALRIEEDGTLAVLDWKSSNGTYADHFIQIAAYTKLLERKLSEWAGCPVTLSGGVHLCRFSKGTEDEGFMDGGNFVHHHWRRAQLDIGWSAFTWLRSLHAVRKPIENLVK